MLFILIFRFALFVWVKSIRRGFYRVFGKTRGQHYNIICFLSFLASDIFCQLLCY